MRVAFTAQPTTNRMEKVSIGLRGWRFDEEAVFTDDGEFRPLDDIDDDVLQRLVRLSVLVGSPCDACWLVHGDDNIESCNVVEAVYGEPMSEVVVCREHERDLIYWYQHEGGDEYRGEEAFQDAFYEWFEAGNRAPDSFAGLEHVDTDPGELPDPPEPDQELIDAAGAESGDRIDLRDVDLDTEYPSE